MEPPCSVPLWFLTRHQNLVDDVDVAMTEIQFLFTRIKLILWRNRSQQGRVICHWVKQCWIRWRRFVFCGVNLSFSFCQFSLPASPLPQPSSNSICTFLPSLFHFLCSHLLIQTVCKMIRDLVKLWISFWGLMCSDDVVTKERILTWNSGATSSKIKNSGFDSQ